MAIDLNKGKNELKYYYSEDGKTIGPFTLPQLLEKIEADTLVYREGIEWTNAKDVEEFRHFFSSKVNNPTDKTAVTNTKKTKRRWVLPIIVASIVIITGGVLFYEKSNNSVLQENSVDQVENEWEKEYIERIKIADPDNSYEEEGDGYKEEWYTISDPDGSSNLRDKPNGDIIREVFDSEQFKVLSETNSWTKVKFADGEVGFIHSSRVVKYEIIKHYDLNNKDNTQSIKELGKSSFSIKIKNNLKNVNIRNYPITGDVVDKISGGQIYTVTKVFEASEPIYLLKYEMSFKDIETGEDIVKPADFKLINLREFRNDIFYAEVLNIDNTVNKITIERNNFQIEYNDWFYLKELNGWIYSKFVEKIAL